MESSLKSRLLESEASNDGKENKNMSSKTIIAKYENLLMTREKQLRDLASELGIINENYEDIMKQNKILQSELNKMHNQLKIKDQELELERQNNRILLMKLQRKSNEDDDIDDHSFSLFSHTYNTSHTMDLGKMTKSFLEESDLHNEVGYIKNNKNKILIRGKKVVYNSKRDDIENGYTDQVIKEKVDYLDGNPNKDHILLNSQLRLNNQYELDIENTHKDQINNMTNSSSSGFTDLKKSSY